MDKIDCTNDDKPTLYGAVVLYFPLTISKELLQTEMHSCKEIRIYEEFIEVIYKEVKNLYTWEVDQLLTNLFDKCNLEELFAVLHKYQGTALIDICFYHKEKYPALLFSGKNMDIIHSLHADISIDPY